MKILVFYIFATVISICSYAQELDIMINADSIADLDKNFSDPVCIDPIEKEAKFPGGLDSLNCLIESKWDKKIINSYNEEGRIIIQYTVDTLGKMQKIQVNPNQIVKLVTHLDFETDDMIIEQIYNSFKDLPDWEPSSINGKKVKSRWIHTLKFPYEYKCSKD